jgi:hypothetical protein
VLPPEICREQFTDKIDWVKLHLVGYIYTGILLGAKLIKSDNRNAESLGISVKLNQYFSRL